MGSARTAALPNGRFVTFKRRLVPDPQAELDGAEWGLWIDREEMPTRIPKPALSGVERGRFKAFPVQSDPHLPGVLGYVEANPLRARMAAQAP
jgi:hypothetical protein